jgi:hypothetical protein
VAANTFTSWSNPSEPPGLGTSVQFGNSPVFRNNKDKILSGYRGTPDAQYPDGYLGTMSSNRRQDKVLGTLSRMNARQYTRGVHKGERINAGDYLWPDEFNKWTALQLQEQGLKFAPPGADPVRLMRDGNYAPRGIPRDQDKPENRSNPERRAKLKGLAPAWK